MSGAEVDERGKAYAPGHIVVPGCGPTLIEERYYSCPVAAAHQPWVGRVLRMHELVQAKILALTSLTTACGDALLAVEHEFNELRFQIQKRERQLHEVAAAARAGR